jgi:hypothetical protein
MSAPTATTYSATLCSLKELSQSSSLRTSSLVLITSSRSIQDSLSSFSLSMITLRQSLPVLRSPKIRKKPKHLRLINASRVLRRL